jgi:glutaredoxin
MDLRTTASRRVPAAALVFGLLLGPMLALSPTQAGAYKWTDAQGVLHFSDRPPPSGHADRVPLPATSGARSGSAPQLAPRSTPEPTQAGQTQAPRPVKAKPVVMFSAPWCGYCREARRYFQANQVAFRERDVDKDPAARREFERLGGAGLPLILVGDQRLSGFSEDSFRRLYDR